ncbi:MAG: sigma-70 family RNA polymerase sigma factor [Pirellulales bacterium]
MEQNERQIDGIARLVRDCAEQVKVDRTSAISTLYDLTAQRLIRFAVTITRNQHDAEDAVHASLIRVSGTPELLLRAQQPWHYLLQMVRNDALQILRRRKPASELGPLDGLVISSPSDGLAAAETNLAVWTALGKLPSEQSEIVVLKVWEEMTFHQISEVLQIPLPTAASRYRYALEKLAVFLRHQCQEVSCE